MPMDAKLTLDKKKADAGLKQFERDAEQTGKRVTRKLSASSSQASAVKSTTKEMSDIESLKVGIEAAGFGGDKLEKLGKFSGARKLAIAAGAFAVAVKAVTTAIEYFKQKLQNTIEVLGDNVQENKRTYTAMQERHKKELEAIQTLRMANNMRGDSTAKLSQQLPALGTISRYSEHYNHVLSYNRETGNLSGIDETEQIIRERQRLELIDNLKRQEQDILEQKKNWQSVSESLISTKAEIATAGDKLKELDKELIEVRNAAENLEKYDYAQERRKSAANFVSSNLKPERELQLQEKINELRASGNHDEADALELELELLQKKLDVTKDISEEDRKALLDQKRRIREMRAAQWRQSQNDSVQSLRERIMTMSGRGREAEISRALRDAERSKGSKLTDDEASKVKELASLTYQLNNIPRIDPSKFASTNELTSRGGFASAGERSFDLVIKAVQENAKTTSSLLTKINEKLDKLEFVK